MGKVEDGAIKVDGDEGTAQGWAHSTNEFSKVDGGIILYFFGRFHRPPDSWGTWKGGLPEAGKSEQEGPDVGAWLEYDLAPDEALELQVGISFVGVEQARQNLESEIQGWDFAALRQQSEDLWEAQLGALQFEGGSLAQRKIMATALYHAFQMPGTFTDADGSYLGLDHKVHQAEGFVYHTNFSLWDTYRTFHPLLVLLACIRNSEISFHLSDFGHLPLLKMHAERSFRFS